MICFAMIDPGIEKNGRSEDLCEKKDGEVLDKGKGLEIPRGTTLQDCKCRGTAMSLISLTLLDAINSIQGVLLFPASIYIIAVNLEQGKPFSLARSTLQQEHTGG
jgi:hypothetical protein